MFVDSHCHLNMLDLSPYDGDLSALIKAANDVGVERMLCVGVDLVHAQNVIDIAQQYSCVAASVGIHPSEKMVNDVTIEQLIALAQQSQVVAIGETGLDYYYNDSGFEVMRERFCLHIQAAKQLKKPLIIHSRNAQQDTITIMRQQKANEIRGVMHCFTESWEMAEKALELDFYISFSGIITFKNAKNVAEVAQRVPLEKILIETDAPYLAPEPFRGKKNEPKYVPYVAAKIAEIKNISIEQVAQQTTQNYFELFGK